MKAAAAILAALSIVGCAQPPKPPPPPLPQYSERIILLPNRDGRQSAVIVKRATGDQELGTPYQALELTGAKEQPAQLSESAVEQRYGAVLGAQPARPFSYTLYFNTATTELTPQSKTLLNEVRVKLKGFPAVQVTVIGHTDRVGTSEANDALSLKRAAVVRDMLIKTGIAVDAIDAVGRGEREPLVATSDGRPEERNRRVEIKLR